MNTSRHVIQFVLVAMLVAIVGGFAGWYFFVQRSISDTEALDQARGLGEDTSFGSTVGSTYQNIISELTGENATDSSSGRAPRIWQVAETPVAGFGFAAGSASVYFAERATGNILKADPDTSSIIRLSNTLLPKVREAHFSRSGDVILRTTTEDGTITSYAATIATSSASMNATSTPNVLQGVYLASNIESLSLQANQSTSRGIFFVGQDPSSGSVGATSDWKGTSVKRIFVSPLRQWRTQWLSDGKFVITQKAADSVPGYSFMVTTAGAMTPLVSDIPGLTVLHHSSAGAFLYGASRNGALELYVKRSAGAEAVLLPIATTADKCVWAPGSGLIAYCAVPLSDSNPAFLNAWYQGALHTTDAIWKIEADSGTAERFFTTDSRLALDIENLAIDENGTHIGFQNAADKSLWLLRIGE